MYKDKRVEKKKTVTMKRNLNPIFNESFAFDIPTEKLRETTIIITVMDKDKLSRNDVIGKVGDEAGGVAHQLVPGKGLCLQEAGGVAGEPRARQWERQGEPLPLSGPLKMRGLDGVLPVLYSGSTSRDRLLERQEEEEMGGGIAQGPKKTFRVRTSEHCHPGSHLQRASCVGQCGELQSDSKKPGFASRLICCEAAVWPWASHLPL